MRRLARLDALTSLVMLLAITGVAAQFWGYSRVAALALGGTLLATSASMLWAVVSVGADGRMTPRTWAWMRALISVAALAAGGLAIRLLALAT